MNIVDVWDNDLIIRIERKKKKKEVIKDLEKKNKKKRIIKVKSKREPS